MRTVRRKQRIAAVRKELGWAYRDCLWFTEKEASEANQKRDELMALLRPVSSSCASGTKPFLKSISPGCRICVDGRWGCNYINFLCSRNCFFCPQDRSIRDEQISQTEGFEFTTPEEHVEYLKTFDIKGVAFSGGEPLMAKDRLFSHLEAIRSEFGASIYIWMYTNGDLINNDVLRRLRDVGLDELRFDLSARDYDLAPVILAHEIMPTITIEIPAIPEDLEQVKDLLIKAQDLGVDFVNLHQMTATQFNHRKLRERGYHFLHQEHIPVFESEICALQLLLFCQENCPDLPVNYCNAIFKHRFQQQARRVRHGNLFLKDHEELTPAAYIRSISVADEPDHTTRLEKKLRNLHLYNQRISDGRVLIHGASLDFVDSATASVLISYSRPGLELTGSTFVQNRLAAAHKPVFDTEGWHSTTIDAWRRLFIGGEDRAKVMKDWFQNYPDRNLATMPRIAKEEDALHKIHELEIVDSGLPDVF